MNKIKRDGTYRGMKINYYCDMDGVLADFNGAKNAIYRYEKESGFFKGLKPIKNNLSTIKRMIADGKNVYILSASPNENADNDKIAWLHKYLPTLSDGKIIIIRNGQSKVDYIKGDGIHVLFDDFGKNINEFRHKGHAAYRIDKEHTIKRALQEMNA